MMTVYILWLRQLKKFWRSKARIIGSLGQPILFLFALGFGFGPTFAKAGEGNYIQFLAPGIIAMSILFSSVFFGIEIIFDRQFGFLKETLVAPVSRLSIMIGRTLGGATVATIQGTLVFFISFLAGFRPVSISGSILGIAVMAITAVLFTSLGTAIASKLQDAHAFQMIMNFVIMPIFFLSGALFPFANLPPVLDFLTRIDPLSYAVDALRGALTGVSHFGVGYDMAVLIIITGVILGAGSYLFSTIEL
jgi:ABC-2 type transport system permease protein